MITHATRWAVLLSIGLAASGVRPASAQLLVEVRAGATATSTLVEDSIVQSIEAHQNVAPMIAISVGTQLSRHYALSLGLGWARSTLESRAGSSSTPILSLTVWTASVALTRQIVPSVTVRGTLGAIKYAPEGDRRASTLFRDDAPLVPAVGVGARLERGIGHRLAAGLDLSYDLHRFTTQTLRANGFRGESTVHRVSLGVSLARHP